MVVSAALVVKRSSRALRVYALTHKSIKAIRGFLIKAHGYRCLLSPTSSGVRFEASSSNRDGIEKLKPLISLFCNEPVYIDRDSILHPF